MMFTRLAFCICATASAKRMGRSGRSPPCRTEELCVEQIRIRSLFRHLETDLGNAKRDHAHPCTTCRCFRLFTRGAWTIRSRLTHARRIVSGEGDEAFAAAKRNVATLPRTCAYHPSDIVRLLGAHRRVINVPRGARDANHAGSRAPVTGGRAPRRVLPTCSGSHSNMRFRAITIAAFTPPSQLALWVLRNTRRFAESCSDRPHA